MYKDTVLCTGSRYNWHSQDGFGERNQIHIPESMPRRHIIADKKAHKLPCFRSKHDTRLP